MDGVPALQMLLANCPKTGCKSKVDQDLILVVNCIILLCEIWFGSKIAIPQSLYLQSQKCSL